LQVELVNARSAVLLVTGRDSPVRDDCIVRSRSIKLTCHLNIPATATLRMEIVSSNAIGQ
jgi:hypothetical protein